MIEISNCNTVENGNAVAGISEMNENHVNENTEITVENGNTVLVRHEETENEETEKTMTEKREQKNSTIKTSKYECSKNAIGMLEFKDNATGQKYTLIAPHQIDVEPEKYIMVIEKGKLKQLSELAMAIMFQKHHQVVYQQGKGFFEYQGNTGLWTAETDIEMERKVTDCFTAYFTALGVLDGIYKLQHKTLRNVLNFLKTRTVVSDFFENPEIDAKSGVKYWLHCKNGVVEITEDGEMKLKPFSPKYHSLSRCEQNYDPNAPTPARFFDELLNPAMSVEDQKTLQTYLGQCLLGENISQTMLMMTGPAGRGKSSIVNMINILLADKCSVLRMAHVSGRFEIGQYIGKNLLIGPDVPSDFLTSPKSNVLKSLTGNDILKAEFKGCNETQNVHGCFNVMLTSNAMLRVKLDGDDDAWRRRIIWIEYSNQHPVSRTVKIEEVLLKKEGSGILKWMLDGAMGLLRNGGKIELTPEQKQKVNLLLEESDPVKSFAKAYIEKDECST
ncbi:MAG: hypothetical protein J5858_15785, partial [Lentisphaeria bacterium]|nr:hypothetical protein [Lentisphaeria bacterium]